MLSASKYRQLLSVQTVKVQNGRKTPSYLFLQFLSSFLSSLSPLFVLVSELLPQKVRNSAVHLQIQTTTVRQSVHVQTVTVLICCKRQCVCCSVPRCPRHHEHRHFQFHTSVSVSATVSECSSQCRAHVKHGGLMSARYTLSRWRESGREAG